MKDGHCIHEMPIEWCATCSPKQPKRTPNRRTEPTEQERRALKARELEATGYVVIHTNSGRDHHSFNDLDETTTLVHIDGGPFLWAIQKILKLAPNLEALQVIPSMYRKLNPNSHHRLLAEREVTVMTGHHRPNMAWKKDEVRSPHYKAQQQFFENLDGEQQRLWEELLFMNFDAAEMTSRYFCLNDEPYTAQRFLAEEHGLLNETQVSMRINAILRYLDPTFKTGERSEQIAGMIKKRVERLRPLLEAAESRTLLAKSLGIAHLPEKLRLADIPDFELLLASHRDGRLEWLAGKNEKAHRALTLRLGLEEGIPTTARTLQEVGEKMALTRERIRQLCDKALDILVEAQNTEGTLSEPHALRSARVRARVAREAGIKRTPKELPTKLFGLFLVLTRFYKEDGLASLRESHPHAHRALCLKFSLGEATPTFRNNPQVARAMGIRKAKARQLYAQALQELKLNEKGEHLVKKLVERAMATQPLDSGRSPGETLTGRDNIAKAVCEYYGVTLTEFRSPGRQQPLAHQRQVFMYLLYERAGMSYPEIATFLNRADHTTILHGHRKIQRELATDRILQGDVQSIVTPVIQDQPTAHPSGNTKTQAAKKESSSLPPQKVLRAACAHFQIDEEQIRAPCPQRKILLYIALENTGLSLAEVAAFLQFSEEEVQQAHKEIAGKATTDTQTFLDIKKIKERLLPRKKKRRKKR